MDIILIEELTVFCIIGLLPHERRNPQYVHVDIRISIPQRQHEDTLEGSVDYCHISSWIEGFLLEEKFLTLEKACQDLIYGMFVDWELIQEIDLTLRKPTAIPNARAVGIRMNRIRPR